MLNNFLLPNSLTSLFSIFSRLLINILKTASSSTDSHGSSPKTSQRKDHLFLSSISWSTTEGLAFLQPQTTAPWKRQSFPHTNSSLSEVSDLLDTATQFTLLSNKLTQCYVGCILQGVASFQRVNDTKSYRTHCLLPEIPKKKNKLTSQMRTNVCQYSK